MTQSLGSAFKCAAQGVAHAFRTGRNFKIELGFAIAAIALGVLLRIDLTQWAVVFTCIGVVLGGECANSAMESLVDLVSPEYNELAKHAKDCAAGAVFITSIASLFVAAFVYLPIIVDIVF